MAYRGKVRNGVVVVEGEPPLEEGTEVSIEPIKPLEPRAGSAEAVMQSAGMWADDADEMDRLLAELKASKRAEVQAQIQSERNKPNPFDAD